MNTADLEKLPTNEIAALVTAGAAILARRAGAVARPAQAVLFPDFAPLDPESVDRGELLLDGSRRFRRPKEVQHLLNRSEDTIVRKIRTENIGFQIGGRYFVDMTRISGHK